MKTFVSAIKQEPFNDNDKIIKKELVKCVGDNKKMDKVIDLLNERFSITQIYKVYYQNFT